MGQVGWTTSGGGSDHGPGRLDNRADIGVVWHEYRLVNGYTSWYRYVDFGRRLRLLCLAGRTSLLIPILITDIDTGTVQFLVVS
jgi:hypothetical protein